jgi:heterotetrameric sarcosine oxidase gamma subunit
MSTRTEGEYMPDLPVSGPAVTAEPAIAAEDPGPWPGWTVPLARSPIAPAEPVAVVAGWQVSAVRAASPELTLTDCTPLAKVAVAARRAEVYGVRFGRAARDPAGTLVVGSGPGEWLLIGPPGQAPALTTGLERLVGPHAPDDATTWVDLTHGRALIRLTGDRAVDVLAKLSAIDLDDDLVPDGAALRTAVAAVATDVIRDDADGARSYLLHCERSVGQYLFDAIRRAGAEFGIGVDGFRLPGPAAPG